MQSVRAYAHACRHVHACTRRRGRGKRLKRAPSSGQSAHTRPSPARCWGRAHWRPHTTRVAGRSVLLTSSSANTPSSLCSVISDAASGGAWVLLLLRLGGMCGELPPLSRRLSRRWPPFLPDAQWEPQPRGRSQGAARARPLANLRAAAPNPRPGPCHAPGCMGGAHPCNTRSTAPGGVGARDKRARPSTPGDAGPCASPCAAHSSATQPHATLRVAPELMG